MKRKLPEAAPDEDAGRIIERPDGWYWQPKGEGKDVGPFPTRADAVADMRASEDTGYEPGESVEEAEAEIGIADWIDEETGAPAEGSVPRIEDH
ncbi:MAG: hypothetical protein U1F64_15525 [Burkholderiales bacterium]